MTALGLCALLLLSTLAFAQGERPRSGSVSPAPVVRDYPKEIRGYKVELANVDVRQTSKETGDEFNPGAPSNALIQLGEPRVNKLSPLGVTLEIPVTVSPVKQGGRVDFLTFEDMVVNGTSLTIDDYNHSFDLPNDRPMTLPDPITIQISTPRAMLSVLGEWNKPKEMWPVTGRVYVFGHFKKFLFKFKRVVPVELNLLFRNPLKSKDDGSWKG